MTGPTEVCYNQPSNLTMRREQGQHGGYREGAGSKTAFPGKDLARPFYLDMTPVGRAALARWCELTGLSRSDVIGALVDYVASTGLPAALDIQAGGTWFPGKLCRDVQVVRLTRRQGAILRRIVRAEKVSVSDIAEYLVMFSYGVKFPPSPGKDSRGRRRRNVRAR